MKQVVSISFHDSLVSKTIELLEQEGMGCLKTQIGIPELISQLQNYKEEGKYLFPDIFIFDDFNLIKKIIINSQFCFIGKGEKNTETLLKALKKCAPLTENGWAIYILRTEEDFEYGVFRGGTYILSESPEDVLINYGSKDLKVILIHQISDKLIEIKGGTANTLIISYGSKSAIHTSPLLSQTNFIDSITKNVHPALIDQTKLFFKKVFLQVLRRGHGSLACVVNSRVIPKRLTDGIVLTERIDVPNLINKISKSNDKDLASIANLENHFALIVGMMQSDGITVFTDKGEVAAYNIFVKHSQKFDNIDTNGGARSRTFLTLCKFINKGIVSAYIQSQDGKIEYR